MNVGLFCLRLLLRFYPRAWRDRFAEEMLATWLDQFDAVVTTGRESPLRFVVRSVAGVIRNLVPVHLQQRRVAVSHPDLQPPGQRMRSIGHDVRFALRTLRKQPGFTAITVLTLALGIGANTAVFSVLNSVVLSPLPYTEPQQLVRLYEATTEEPGMRNFLTVPDVVDVREDIRAFSSVGISYTYEAVGGDLTSNDGATQRIRLMPVSAGYFATLRATPLLGRSFTKDEELPDLQRVVLSHGLWRRVSGGDSAIVGKSVRIDGVAMEVIGVMRPTFLDVVAGEVDAWTAQNTADGGYNNRDNHYVSAIARLAPGTSIDQAQSEMDAMMRRLGEQFPNTNDKRRIRVLPLHADVVGESTSAIYILVGAAGLVLLMACLNVANLFISRAVARSQETAVRTALGAARHRLVVLRLTESVLVAAMGGAIGSVLASLGVRGLLSVSPDALARAEEVSFDARLLMFGIVVTVVTSLLFGGWPAWIASRVDPSDALRDGSRGNTGGRRERRGRSVLVASQVAVAIVLLSGAGMLLRSFIERQRVDLGFTTNGLTTFQVNLPTARYADGAARIRLHDAYQERLRTLPGVEQVGAASWLPANGGHYQWGFRKVGAEGFAPTQIRVIDGDYLAAFGITVREGRQFTVNDRMDTDSVALISESLAKRLYADGSAIGSLFRTAGREFTIAGIVADVAYQANGQRADMVYLSHDQFGNNRNWAMTYVVKSNLPTATMVEQARQTLASIDRELVVHEPKSMNAVLARHRAREQFMTLLVGAFATLALTLAAVGVYGVVSYSITQRTHEIGVRLALGARPAQVRFMVLASGLAPAAIGLAAGLAGAIALGGVLGTVTFGISPRDPGVLSGVVGVLSLIVLIAGWVPSRRAARVDPLESLRRH
jgi:putative ABC transport system permease protein